MSTGTDVILCVILAMTKEAWGQHYENLSGRKTPPPVGNDKHDFKKGAKGSIGCFCYCGWLWFYCRVAFAVTLTSNTISSTKDAYSYCSSGNEAIFFQS